jgi:hypothetical protein
MKKEKADLLGRLSNNFEMLNIIDFLRRKPFHHV